MKCVQVSRSALAWAAMLPPYAQDYALAFIAKRLAIQVPSKSITDCNNSEEFFASSLAQYVPFIQSLVDQSFPLVHVSMKTLLEVIMLQLRALMTAVTTIDESDSQLDLDREERLAAAGRGIIKVRVIL